VILKPIGFFLETEDVLRDGKDDEAEGGAEAVSPDTGAMGFELDGVGR